jgi:Manganese containing catalase
VSIGARVGLSDATIRAAEGRGENGRDMFHHIKQLMYTVRIGVPDPHFGNMLLEQFGGANGELAAAVQYSVQGLADPGRRGSHPGEHGERGAVR